MTSGVSKLYRITKNIGRFDKNVNLFKSTMQIKGVVFRVPCLIQVSEKVGCVAS